MKTIITSIRSHTFMYVAFACFIASVALFAVLPAISNIDPGAQGPSLTALFAKASGAAPTATLTVNGQHDVMVKKGSIINYAWTSTGGTSWSSDWTSEGGYCGTSGAWVADTADGTYSWPADVSQVDCTYTITYRVSGPNGSASDTITVTIYETLPASCTIVAEPNPCTLDGNGVCETTITWSTQNMNAPALYVEGSKEILALAKSGSYVAKSITATPVTFVIHEDWQFSPPPPVICSVTVKGVGGSSPVCTGTIPAHASAWDAEESTGLTMSTPWVQADPDTSTKCQFHCDSGYVWYGGNCVLPSGPTCTLTANPQSINQGQSSTLSWTTTGATKDVTLNGVSVATNGSQVVTPNNTSTYTLVASNYNTSVTCTQSVTVVPAPTAPVCSLTFNGLTNAVNVDPMLTRTWAWSSANGETYSMSAVVNSCENPAYNGTYNPWQPWLSPGTGDITGGSNTDIPGAIRYGCKGTNTYTVTNSAGVSKTCMVNVSFKNSTPPPPNAPTCTLTATPSSITAGQSSTLSWTTTNATSVSLNQGIGAVSANGSKSVSPGVTTTYTLTAQNSAGSVTCEKTVIVTSAPVLPTCTLTATPSSITAGQSSTLSWTTTNATSVSLNQGIGAVSANGSKVVSPGVTTTYQLTAQNDAGIVHCSRTITVTVPPPAPTCTLTVTPSSITKGESATLAWTTTNATTAQLNNGIGNVALSGSKSVAPLVTTEYTLTAIGAGGTVTCKTTLAVNEPPVKPTCSLFADRETIIDGESTTLHWSSTNGSTAKLNNETVALSGNKTVSPHVTTTYTLVVTGPGGSVTCEKTITVEPYVPVPPSCTLTAIPAKILKGESTTLSWTTANAQTVTIDQGVGTVALSGNKTVSPTVNTTYTLTATRVATERTPAASVTCVATVIVEDEPEPEPLTCDAFSASPSTLSAPGNTTLTWNTSNATGVTIDNGVGAVSVDGSKVVAVSTTTTFTLTATDGEDTVTCNTKVTVIPDVVIVPKCDAFSISPTSVSKGDTATLTWNTTNATTVTINNGVGSVAVDGNTNVTVNADTTYTLTATNGSASDTCQATVTLKSSGGGGGGGSSSPRCTLTASDKSISAGEKVTLTWKNTRTDRAVLKDNRGNTVFDTKKDDDIDEDADSVVVKPTKSTSYTMTVYRGSKHRDCSVDINVSNVTVTRTPIVAGISLSKLPYTGFDAGPALTAFFYMMLVLWGLIVAYVLVYRNGKISSASFRTLLPALQFPRFTKRENVETSIPGYRVAPTITHTPTRVEPEIVTPIVASAAPAYAPVIGYENLYATGTSNSTRTLDEETEEDVVEEDEHDTDAGDDISFFEDRAQKAHVLMSSEAIRFIVGGSHERTAQTETLDAIIALAKATFPSEGGWVIVNKDRVLTLLK